MRIHKNPDFRSISPNEFIPEGTLVWIELNNLQNETFVEGPFVIEDGWGPIWFGSPNQNKMPNKEGVKLVSTITGDVTFVTWSSFLFSTYYVMNEERLCTDAEIK